MEVLKNIELKPYSTLFIGGPADHLVYAQDNDELIAAYKMAKENNWPLFFLGGGSNALISDKGYRGLVVKIETIGIDIELETDSNVILKLASGEKWDDVVRFAVEQNWWGIENLSHIPGTVGAFAVQNVGAYGQEAAEVVEKVECLDRETGELVALSGKECGFTYRKSIFNTTRKDRYVILHTYIKLSKTPSPVLTYPDLINALENLPVHVDIIREKIIEIRDKKFPYPDEPTSGNLGSFFRGPLLSEDQLKELQANLKENFSPEEINKMESMKPKLRVPQGYKTPTAFLIDICGYKNLEQGGVKINPTQPAVILNHSGEGTAEDVLNLYQIVKKGVFERTGVLLEIEPELVGFSKQEILNLTR